MKAVVEIRNNKYQFFDLAQEKNPRREQKIKEIISSYCKNAKKKFKTKKVAISAADIVDPKKKTIFRGKINFGTEIFDFKFLTSANFSVALENDGRCFTLGEYYFGKGKNKKSILTLALGTGIGGGFLADGHNFQGNNFSAFEVSHMKIFRRSSWQEWEWIAGGKGIEKSYFDTTRKKISSQEIFARAKNGEAAAKKVLAQAQEFLGIGISNLLNILDPQAVIVGGGIANQKKFVENAFQIARKNCFNKKARYQFYISSLKHKANLLGAALLFEKN